MLIAREAAERQAWTSVEKHLASALRAQNPPLSQRVWDLAGIYVAQAQYQRAVTLLRRHQPHAETLQDAKLWFTAWRGHGLDAQATAEALDLAERFPEDPHLASAVIGEILTGTRTPEYDEASGDQAAAAITRHGPGAEPAGGAAMDGNTEQDSRPLVPGDLHRRAVELLEVHRGRHGDASGFQVLQGEPAELTGQITAMLQQRAREGAEREAHLADLLGKVQRGQCPTGVLTAVLQAPYVVGLIQRIAGVQVAGSCFADEHDAEVAAAAAALDQAVVVEPSALVVAEALPAGGEWLRGHFAVVHMAAVSHREAITARAAARHQSAPSGTMAWDSTRRSVVYSETSVAERARLGQRAEAVASAAESTSVLEVSVGDVLQLLNHDAANGSAASAFATDAGSDSVFDDMSKSATEGVDGQAAPVTDAFAGRHAAWLTPAVLAKARGWALWSDDLAVRRLARGYGVAAFGTPALLDALIERRLGALPHHATSEAVEQVAQDHAKDVAALAGDLVVDLPVTVAEVLARAEADDWQPFLAAVPLARPLWWSQALEGMTGLMEILSAVTSHAPEHVDAWTAAAMRGVVLGHEDQPQVASVLLAAVEVISVASTDGVHSPAASPTDMAEGHPADLTTDEAQDTGRNGTASSPCMKAKTTRDQGADQSTHEDAQDPTHSHAIPGVDGPKTSLLVPRSSRVATEHGLPDPEPYYEEAVELVERLRQLRTSGEPKS